MSDTTHGHLNLRAWPFQAVPSEKTAAVWVGRPDVQRRLAGLLKTIDRVDASRIVLLWAAYGAGKTHAMLNLSMHARTYERLRTLYVVTPRGIKSFVEVYRAIIEAALATDVLADLGMELYRKKGPSPPSDLQRALVRMVWLPEPQHRAALNWLKAENVSARELRDSELTRPLKSSADGIETLNELTALLRSELGIKLVVLLDEIQELGQLSGAKLDEAVGGLHKVFDRNTEGLTLVFCFTTTAQQTMVKVIGETLFERRSETIALPPLERDQAVEFIIGLIAAWSIDAARAPFPFTREAIAAVVSHLTSDDGLVPRDLIRAFDVILRAADADIEDGEIKQVDADYALARLREEGGL
jgi:hypothetical protein